MDLMMEKFRSILALCVPPKTNRIPMTNTTIAYTLAPGVILLFMAYLSRRPTTHVIRLALLPFAVASLVYVAFGYVWVEEHMHMSNAPFLCLVMIAKALDFAIPPQGCLKVDERPLSQESLHTPGSRHPHEVPSSSAPSSSFLEAVSLMASLRGIGWEFGRGTPIPAPSRPSSRSGFLLATSGSIIAELAVLDITNSFIHVVPGLNSVAGGSIFRADLPVLQRYLVSTYVTILTGICGASVICLLYDVSSFIGVSILQQQPDDWPPALNKPWIASSLRDFWARWHQFARRTFLVYGGIPGGWLGGRAGRVLGTFIASGLFHEVGMYPLVYVWDWRQPLVFAFMGLFVVGEDVFGRMKGERMSGFWGAVWTWTVLVVLSQPLVDTWFLKGIGGAGRSMQEVGPTTRYIIPHIHRFFKA